MIATRHTQTTGRRVVMNDALPAPTTLTPPHPQTWCALKQAYRLANWANLPNDHAIRLAARSGNLITTIDALNAHRRELGTLVGMLDNLIETCDRLIFKGKP